MHSNYEYNWRWGVVIACSAIRGVFSLLLAPDIYNLAEEKMESPQTVGKIMSRDYYIYSFYLFCSTCHSIQ